MSNTSDYIDIIKIYIYIYIFIYMKRGKFLKIELIMENLAYQITKISIIS